MTVYGTKIHREVRHTGLYRPLELVSVYKFSWIFYSSVPDLLNGDDYLKMSFGSILNHSAYGHHPVNQTTDGLCWRKGLEKFTLDIPQVLDFLYSDLVRLNLASAKSEIALILLLDILRVALQLHIAACMDFSIHYWHGEEIVRTPFVFTCLGFIYRHHLQCCLLGDCSSYQESRWASDFLYFEEISAV